MVKRLTIRRGTALVLAAAVAASVPVPVPGGRMTALAASPVTEYDEETLASFRDNVLEYWEIPGLIENYNSEFRSLLDQFYSNPGGSTGLTKAQMLDLARELRAEADSLSDEAKEEKDDIPEESYKAYQDNIKALRRYARQMEEASEGRTASGLTAVWGMKELRDKRAKDARALMRQYQNELAQSEIKAKSLEIAEASCQSAKMKQGLSMATAEDVLDAERALNSSRAEDASAKAALKSTRQSLCTMLGWRYDANPEIREVPEADQSVIASFHPGADSQPAIDNNYTLRTKQRTPATGGEFSGRNDKERKMKSWEDEIRFSMNQLYKTILQKQTAYEAARTAYEAATLDKGGADRNFQLGQTSRQEHMQAEVTFLGARAASVSANMDLLAAIEDYEWAKKGLLEIKKEGA